MDNTTEQIVEDQKQMLSTVYDRTNAYNTIIFLVGYTGFFSLWVLVKDEISTKQMLWSAIFISISLLSLVFFEVYKMSYSAWMIFRWKKDLIDDTSENCNFVENWKEFKKKIDTSHIWHIRIWIIQLIIVIPTGLAAASILLYAFISNLMTLT